MLGNQSLLLAKEISPLYVLGAGYTNPRKFPGWVVQAEYKSGFYLWQYLRPQATLLVSEYGSGYVGLGFGWDFYLAKQIVIIPSFSPGIYWKGNGKDIGCPLEFRSALEISYETKNRMRFGIQISHVSNAHLSHRNPGFNVLALCLAIPFEN